jgi:tetratricopeptide (TPR) repeat protein
VSAALLSLALVLPPGAVGAQTAKPQAKSMSAIKRETEVYREAMAWFRKGEEMIGTDKEHGEEQAEMFRKAIAVRPDFLEAHYDLGLVYLAQNKWRDAAAELETVLRLEPGFDAGIWSLLGDAYRGAGDYDRAIAAVEKGLGGKPDDLGLLKALGYLQFRSGRDAEAAATLGRIIALDPTDAASRLDLALLHQKNDRVAEAVAEYQEALELDPQSFAAHYNLGLLYMRQRKPLDAATEFDAARKLQPANVELLERLGDVRTYLKQYILAADAYQDALDRAGDPARLLPKLGFSLANDGKAAAAVAALEKAVALDAENADAWFLLGDLYADSGRGAGAIDAALAAYKKALALRPGQKAIHLNLGVLYAEKEMYPEAMAELREAVDGGDASDAGYAAAWANIALVAEKLDDDQGAIAAHEKVVALGNATANNYFHLGVLYAKNDRPEPSIDAFAKAVELDPERYRAVLREELKNVHSILDGVRFQKRFMDLLATGQP